MKAPVCVSGVGSCATVRRGPWLVVIEAAYRDAGRGDLSKGFDVYLLNDNCDRVPAGKNWFSCPAAAEREAKRLDAVLDWPTEANRG